MTAEMEADRVRAMAPRERNHGGFYKYLGPGASDNPMSAVAAGDT